MRGLSGATVIVLGSFTVKVGEPGRVGRSASDQGYWITKQPRHLPLPHVTDVFNCGYVMRTLTPPPLDFEWARALDALEVIWASNAAPFWSWMYHRKYVERLCTWVPQAHVLLDRLTDVELSNLRHGPVHGDPTVANVMLDAGERVILIDPVPPRVDLPQMPASDLGKMLQSAYGFERKVLDASVEYGDLEDAVMGRCRDDAERSATRYFAAVHLLRAVPYADAAGVGYTMRGLLDEALRRL